LVLSDAIYFRGAWRESFPSRGTEDGPFRLNSRDSITVPFMHANRPLRVAENQGLQVADLPYWGDDFTMLVVLPRAVDGLASVERGLDPDSLVAWDSRMEDAFVHLALPKFRVGGESNLAGPLSKMGMRDAFTERADFSGIARERLLFVTDVYHSTVMAVDENGTEAAAGTAVVMTKGARRVPPKTMDFTADHPFLFLIRHRPSGTILFMGRVADPS
jgi:serpin B